MCRPEIVMLSEENGLTKPFVDIKNGRHPCIARTFTGEFIPNDVVIGNQVREIAITHMLSFFKKLIIIANKKKTTKRSQVSLGREIR